LDKSAIVGLLFVVSGKREPQGRKLLDVIHGNDRFTKFNGSKGQ
jgi:hypothetical protein